MLKNKEESILTFLQLTKEGTYAEVDISATPYIRYPYTRIEEEEEYYYNSR